MKLFHKRRVGWFFFFKDGFPESGLLLSDKLPRLPPSLPLAYQQLPFLSLAWMTRKSLGFKKFGSGKLCVKKVSVRFLQLFT